MKFKSSRTLFFGLAFISLLLAGMAWFYLVTINRFERSKFEEISAIGKLKSYQIQEWRQERLDDANRMVHSSLLTSVVARYLSKPDDALRARLQNRLAVEQKYGRYENIFLLAPDGSILLAAQTNSAGIGPETKRAIASAIAGREAVFSDLFRDTNGGIKIDVLSIAWSDAGKPLAVVLLRNNVADYLFPLIQSWPAPSRSGESVIVRRDGGSALFLSVGRFANASALTLRLPLTHTNNPAVQAVLGRQGIFAGTDYRGAAVLADLVSIPGSDWCMVVKEDQQEIFADLRTETGLIIFLFVLILILCAAGIISFSRQRHLAEMRSLNADLEKRNRDLQHSESTLRESETAFRLLADSVPQIVWAARPDGWLSYQNQKWSEYTGLKTESSQGDGWSTVIHPDDQAGSLHAWQRSIQTGGEYLQEIRLRRADGVYRWWLVRGVPLRDPSGTIIKWFGTCTDIHDLKSAKDFLQKSSDYTRSLIEASLDPFVTISAEGKITHVNEALLQVTGLMRGQLVGTDFSDYFTEPARAQVAYERVFIDGFVRDCPLAIRHVSGRITEVLYNASLYRTAAGLLGIFATARDITERRQAEVAFKQTEERYLALFQSSIDCVFIHDFAGRFLDANQAALDLLGYGREEITGLTFDSLLSADQHQLAVLVLEEIRTTGRQQTPREFKVRARDGRTFFLESNSTLVHRDGKPYAIQGIARDINERKHLERIQAFVAQEGWSKRPEDFFGRLVELIGRILEVDYVFIGRLKAPETVQTFGLFAKGRLAPDIEYSTRGAPCAKVIGREIGHFSEKLQELFPADALLVEMGAQSYLGIPLLNAAGKVIGLVAVLDSKPMPNARLGTQLLQIAAIRVSGELAANNELMRLHQQNELILNSAAEGIVGLDLQGNHTFVNPAAARMLGHDAATLIGRHSHSLWHHSKPDGSPYPVAECPIYAAYHDGKVHQVATDVFWRKDGTCFPVEYASTAIDDQGQLVGAVITFEDITQRRLAEEALIRSQERYLLMEKAVNDGLWDWNMLTDEEYFSPHWKAIIGYHGDELAGHKSTFLKLIHPDDLTAVQAATRAHLEASEPYRIEFRLRHKDGSYRWVLSRGEAVRDAGGRPTRMIGAIMDIHDRKKALEALRASEAKFRAIFELASIGMAKADPSTGQLLRVNQKMCDLTGYREEELLRLKVAELTHPEDRQRDWNLFQQVVRGERPDYQIEKRYRRKDGSEIWVSVNMTVIRDVAGEPVRALTTIENITARRETEADMRRLAELFQTIETTTQDGFWLVDSQGKIHDPNEVCCSMYGYNQEEFCSMSIQDLEANRNSAETADHIEIILAQGQARFETRHRCKDGRIIDVEVSTTYQPNLGYFITFLRDITQRNQAEERLRLTDRALKTISECNKLLVRITDENELLQEICEIIVKLGGFRMAWIGFAENDEEKSVRIAARAGFDEGYIDEVKIKWSEASDYGCGPTGQAIRSGEVVVSNDFSKDPGTKPWRQAAAARGYAGVICLPLKNAGKLLGLLTIYAGQINAFDQEEIELLSSLADDLALGIQSLRTRYANQKAEEVNARLAAAIEQAAETILITDTQGVISYVNPAFETSSGYSAAEAIGQTPRLLKSGKQNDEFYRHLWDTLKHGEIWQGHFSNKRKDGKIYEEEATITPIRDGHGFITSYVAVKRDVTREILLESQVRQAQKMEAMGTLAGGIAHDFNNILGAVFGFSYLLQQDTADNAAAQENIAEIVKAASRAKDLVQQILTFSRRRETDRKEVMLGPLLKEAVKFLRATLPAGIEIETQVAADAPTILADPTQIYQVVVNLATNALHAMEGRLGRLTVTLEPVQPEPEFITSHAGMRENTPYIRLAVADTGCGMEARTLERIFEPFFTTKPVGKGTGLGLAVVHGIVQSHGGIITVESEKGKGTTFCIYLPVHKRDGILIKKKRREIPPGQGQKILVVDDETALTTMQQKLLKRLQYQVLTANHPQEALDLMRANPAQFDLVITDLTMPEMNGLELAAELHTLRPDLPIILASGYSAALDRATLHAANISELLEKPISDEKLAEAVHRALTKA